MPTSRSGGEARHPSPSLEPEHRQSISLGALSRRRRVSEEHIDPDSFQYLVRQHVDDDRDDSNIDSPSDLFSNAFQRLNSFMSRTPLLLRSSPAQGTGSYGVLPVHAMSSSAGSSELDDDEDIRRETRKGKRPRLQSDPVTGVEGLLSDARRTNSDIEHVSHESSSSRLGARARRARRLSEIRDEALEGQQESGLESRFTTGIGVPASEGMGKVFSHEPSLDESLDSEEAIDVDSPAEWGDEDPLDNSPYPQVRASVSAVDNTSLSINTPRMWTLSLFFAVIGSSTNLFFSLRYPSVSITPVIALLLVHPLGLLWDQLLKRRDDPHETYLHGHLQDRSTQTENGSSEATPLASNVSDHPSWKRRLRLWLAQGKWNEKEHSCVYISSNVSFGFAFATDVIVEQTKFYHQDLGVIYQLLLILSTQILGYTFAGLTRRYLVRPGGMIWPGTLMSTAMFTTLHKEENKTANGWRISRWKFFVIVWASSVAFYFLPGLLFPALSYFNVITWFAPKNVVVSNLFGVASGLGLFPLTFDWAQIAYIGSPLLTPFWAALNVVGGLVVVMWIVAPVLYYANVLYSSYMPILSSAVFDNTGKPYDVSRILTSDFVFDTEAYENYSRVFLPITYVLSYALQFAALTALLTHTGFWHGKDIWKHWRRSLKHPAIEDKAAYQPVSNGDSRKGHFSRSQSGDANQARGMSEPGLDNLMSGEDVHSRLMRRYEDAPISWYLITFVIMTAVGIFLVE
ncbi:MAG: hypothetical protein M1819_001680 [Sarea resinae]|nr:MAG: hypothetical protein M1819_001680 [Sarea resinae]